ncbi:transmembrane protein 109-like [Denticeps clupeoides]|uniref:Transmembrane protein 109-like n=1 Tax=Denticeps clupeoides TaxID=299321 RepID=A0AAY4BZV8_9TELE|nr:transmembrane protein 109-like [Denticeps clupeoides]
MDLKLSFKHASSCTDKAAVVLLLYALLAVVASDVKVEAPASPPASSRLQALLSDTREGLVHYVEAIAGASVVQKSLEVLETLTQVVVEGAASGLNVIAVYVAEILRALGVDAEVPLHHFTPEGIACVAKWGLLALIGYWLLSVFLGLAVSVLRRLFWLLKAASALWLFVLIISDSTASSDTTALRLAGLVLGCALLGLASSGAGGQGDSLLESRLSTLEGRVKVIERG